MKDISQKAKRSIRFLTKLIAMSVRNGMEDFHCEHLSDEQMKKLNPLIRQGIFDVLRYVYLARHGNKQQKAVAAAALGYWCATIPIYWEEPDTPLETLEKELNLSHTFKFNSNTGQILTELNAFLDQGVFRG